MAGIAPEPSAPQSKVWRPRERPAEVPPLIEDHALIGDMYTAALVARDGSIDFLCLPDFDSDATFASLLGTPENGRWKICPNAPIKETRRRYRGRTLILETEWETQTGVVRIIDCMPLRDKHPHLIRMVEGVSGSVSLHFQLKPRFANGLTVPRIRPRDGTMSAVAGPDGIYLRGPGGHRLSSFSFEFVVKEGERHPFVLTWAPSFEDIPPAIDPEKCLEETEAFWEGWAGKLQLPSKYGDLVLRSLLTLKACCFQPTGAIVAAPTFGLPETPGGERNWDYRYCWLRDSWLTLSALMRAGAGDEARGFAHWLMDAIGGAARQLQIMYGIRGERVLTEFELPWLSGYQNSKPVRVGNGAWDQFQLDVFGEFALSMYNGKQLMQGAPERIVTALGQIAEIVEQKWRDPDHGLWEMRGPKQHFTASKVAAWVAVDCWLRTIEEHDLPEDQERWVKLREEIFDEVMTKGFDEKRNTFTQYYGSKGLDASLLFIPLAGFLPPDDPRVIGTVAAIEKELMPDGFVLRYNTDDNVDGLSGVEGVFLPCTFWLASTYHMMGRHEDARRVFEKVAALCNDVGLLAEEYMPQTGQQVGNFPQAFSHLALINSAFVLSEGEKPMEQSRMES